MRRTLFWFIILISIAHALVHTFEFSLPAVEEFIALDFHLVKRDMGWMATVWRVPYGLGAIFAALLVNKLGARRMLTLYLFGCGLSCLAVGMYSGSEAWPVFLCMLMMGLFASIYHPAGLTLLAAETTPETRTHALGIHGVFGSIGIGAAPLLCGLLLSINFDWQEYYFLLAFLGITFGTLFLFQIRPKKVTSVSTEKTYDSSLETAADQSDWKAFAWLSVLSVTQGMVYAGVMSFLPRSIGLWEPEGTDSPETLARYTTSVVLLLGCVGQYAAGRFGREEKLEWQLAIITFLNILLLIWMALSSGVMIPISACAFAIIHFMHQPLYNSLIARYIAPHRRSLAYGLSFALGMGMGSMGAIISGYLQVPSYAYFALAGVATISTMVSFYLCILAFRNRPENRTIG